MTTEPTEQTRTVQVIECEVYSRVVGYYRPVSGWNIGKKQEFEERKPVSFQKVKEDKK